MYPDLDKKEIKSFLKDVVEERVVNPKAQLHNNYAHMKMDVDLLSVIDWYEDKKPIAAGFGVFFKNQDQVLNPSAVMLQNFLDLRKVYKNQLKNYLETSYEYATFDRLQLTEKINANSYYGA
jgi:DNA polymerase elongation subunit (family B)